MLALAIISTVILSIFILAINASLSLSDEPAGFVIIAMLGFVIMCVWVLYAR